MVWQAHQLGAVERTSVCEPLFKLYGCVGTEMLPL